MITNNHEGRTLILISWGFVSIECLVLGVEYSTQGRFIQALNGVQFGIYVTLMHGYFGQTLGKMLMDVKVLNYETEINIKQALRRESVNLI